jgi:hypothetical protein
MLLYENPRGALVHSEQSGNQVRLLGFEVNHEARSALSPQSALSFVVVRPGGSEQLPEQHFQPLMVHEEAVRHLLHTGHRTSLQIPDHAFRSEQFGCHGPWRPKKGRQLGPVHRTASRMPRIVSAPELGAFHDAKRARDAPSRRRTCARPAQQSDSKRTHGRALLLRRLPVNASGHAWSTAINPDR